MTAAPTADTRRELAKPDDEVDRRPMWEIVECNCPDYCERDHEQD